MRRSTFMTVAALLAAVFGLAYGLFPAQLLSLYGVTLDTVGQWPGRYFGSALIGIAVLTWLARKTPPGEALRAIMLGDFVIAATGLVVAVFDRLYGPGNAFVWSTVVIYAFLTAGFGYFQFVSLRT